MSATSSSGSCGLASGGDERPKGSGGPAPDNHDLPPEQVFEAAATESGYDLRLPAEPADRRHARHRQAGLFKHRAVAARREPAQVGAIHHAGLGVVETTEDQAADHRPLRDV